MKVTISKGNITSLITKIQNIVPAKPSIPVLANVLLEAVDGKLIISATNLSLSITASIDAQVLEEGSVVLPSKRLFSLIRELTAPEVDIRSIDSHSATLKSGTSSFKILGIPGENFPKIPEFSQGEEVAFSSALLKELLSKTSFAAGKDETRPIFSTILLQRQNELTTFTGTDGKKLAKAYTDAPAPATWKGSFILPTKAVEEMIHLLDGKEETVQLRFSDDRIFLQAGAVTLISQLIAGQYPDVSRIIPESIPSPIKLHREELISLLRQVSLFTTTERTSVRFTFEEGTLHLSAANGETGEGNVTMPVNYTGERMDVAFNPTYFLDILRHSQDEIINLSIKDPYDPGLITDSSKALFVIMPMRLES